MIKEKEIRTRNWFITINHNAECFVDFKERVTVINKLSFAYILHDKDIQVEPHYHCVLKYQDAKTFGMIQKHFPGAHIEPAESMFKCCRYLIHLDDPDKFQYSVSEVADNENLFGYFVQHDDHLKLDEITLIENVENGNVTNIVDAIKLFGLKQVNLYRNTINEVLNFYIGIKDNQYKAILKSYQERLMILSKSNSDLFDIVQEYDNLFAECGLNLIDL